MLLDWIPVRNVGFEDLNTATGSARWIGKRPDEADRRWEVRLVYNEDKTFINVFREFQTHGNACTIRYVGQLMEPGYISSTEALERVEMQYVYTLLEYMAALPEEAK